MTPHDGNGTDDAPEEETSIVKYDGGKDPSVPPDSRVLATALIWCGLGACAVTSLSVVGMAMMAYGVAFGRARGLSRARLALCAVAGAAGLAAGALWTQAAAAVLVKGAIDGACALVVGLLAAGRRATVTTDYLVAAAACVGYIACDFGFAAAAGIDPAAVLGEAVSSAIEEASLTYGLDVAAELRSLSWLFGLLWPFGYFVLAGIGVLGAHYGGFLGRVRPGEGSPWRPVAFDAPAWSVVALIVGVALFCFGGLFGAFAAQAQAAGVTVVLAVRFIFLMQGYAVLTWWFNRHHVGCLARTLVLVLAIDLEVTFFVVSILGLVDFWADFRHMRASAEGSGEGEK